MPNRDQDQRRSQQSENSFMRSAMKNERSDISDFATDKEKSTRQSKERDRDSSDM